MACCTATRGWCHCCCSRRWSAAFWSAISAASSALHLRPRRLLQCHRRHLDDGPGARMPVAFRDHRHCRLWPEGASPRVSKTDSDRCPTNRRRCSSEGSGSEVSAWGKRHINQIYIMCTYWLKIVGVNVEEFCSQNMKKKNCRAELGGSRVNRCTINISRTSIVWIFLTIQNLGKQSLDVCEFIDVPSLSQE